MIKQVSADNEWGKNIYCKYMFHFRTVDKCEKSGKERISYYYSKISTIKKIEQKGWY